MATEPQQQRRGASLPAGLAEDRERERPRAPGMLPATMIVAPNSPSARAKASSAPGDDAAARERQRDREEDATRAEPSERAICSSAASTCSKAARAVRTSSGRPTAVASADGLPGEHEVEPSGSPRSARATRSAEVRRHRRHHERQRHEGLDQALAAEAAAREQPRQPDARRQDPRSRRRSRTVNQVIRQTSSSSGSGGIRTARRHAARGLSPRRKSRGIVWTRTRWRWHFMMAAGYRIFGPPARPARSTRPSP